MAAACRRKSNQNRARLWACSNTGLSLVYFNHHCGCNPNMLTMNSTSGPNARTDFCEPGTPLWRWIMQASCIQAHPAMKSCHSPGSSWPLEHNHDRQPFILSISDLSLDVLRDKQGLDMISCPGLNSLMGWFLRLGRDLEGVGVEAHTTVSRALSWVQRRGAGNWPASNSGIMPLPERPDHLFLFLFLNKKKSKYLRFETHNFFKGLSSKAQVYT